MNQIYQKQFQIIKKNLKIEKIISIRFSNTKTINLKKYQDTACTALGRSLNNNISTYIDRQTGQLCAGGNYFLNINKVSPKDVCDIYVKEERMFKKPATARQFINNLPKYPHRAEKRYIMFTPLALETKIPDVILFTASPAQTGRVLGLSVYRKMIYPTIMPAISTCASIYAPLSNNHIHLNFIDYFDRYFQGIQRGRPIWKDSDLIISMPYKIFKEIIKYIPLSAHGSYQPKIKS